MEHGDSGRIRRRMKSDILDCIIVVEKEKTEDDENTSEIVILKQMTSRLFFVAIE